MLKTFEDVQRQISHQVWKTVNIDNAVFRLHYRLTFWALLTATVLVSSRQYIGEHIRCISDTIATHVVNTFCFFTTTFTIPRHNNDSQVPHPGVGPLGRADLEDEPVVHHAYYQWVPFVLFGQALMFYLPHLLWRTIEGGTIKLLVDGLEHGYLAIADREIGKAPSRSRYMQQVGMVRRTFLSRLRLNKWWGQWLISCELLNCLNIVLQFVITDAFLGGRFLDLGPSVAGQRPGEADPLDLVFPKVTKCTFQKYGPTGTIQKHDALCVMALNVINEKIYTFLWFWFVVLAVLTALGMVWRMLTVCLYSRSPAFNRYLFDWNGKLDPYDFEIVMSRCEFSHWLFLYYLCRNMHISAKAQLFKDLAAEMRELRRNGYHNQATLPLPSRGGKGFGPLAGPESPLRPRAPHAGDADDLVRLDEPDGGALAPLVPNADPTAAAPDSGRPHSD